MDSVTDQKPYNISRNHAPLEREGDTVIVKDRGSSLGTHVNEGLIGVRTTEKQRTLADGDIMLVLRSRMSLYHFRIHIQRR